VKMLIKQTVSALLFLLFSIGAFADNVESIEKECANLSYTEKKQCYKKAADNFYDDERYEDALTYYKKAFNYSGKKKTWSRLADKYLDEGRTDLAITYYKSSYNSKGLEKAYNRKAEEYLEKDKLILAATYYGKAKNFKAQKDAYNLLGEKYLEQKNYTQAGHYFEKGGKRESMTDAYMKAGRELYEKGKYERAEYYLKKTGNEEELRKVYQKLAPLHAGKKNHGKSAEYYEKLGNTDKARSQYRLAAGKALKENEYEKAVDFYRKGGDDKAAQKALRKLESVYKVTYISSTFTGRLALDGLTSFIILYAKSIKAGKKKIQRIKDIALSVYGKKNTSFKMISIKSIKGTGRISNWRSNNAMINRYVKSKSPGKNIYILHYMNWYEHTKYSSSQPLKINISYYYKIYYNNELKKTLSFSHLYTEPKYGKSKKKYAQNNTAGILVSKHRKLLNQVKSYLRKTRKTVKAGSIENL